MTPQLTLEELLDLNEVKSQLGVVFLPLEILDRTSELFKPDEQ